MLRRGFSRGQSSGDSLPTHGGSSSSIEGFSSSSSGYGGFSVFGGYNNGGKYNKHKRVGYFPLTYVSIGIVVLNVILTGLWMNSKGHYRSLLLALNAKDVSTAIFKVQWTEKEVARVRNEMATDERLAETRYGPRIRQLERENKKWKTERDQLKEKYESPKKKQVDSRLKKREPAYLEQIELMQRAIRKESRRTVLERFGPGPHEVQMTFTHNEIDYDFVIETAPLNTVPHAIHLFLEQVEHGLWTGSYFYINTMNVLQAGPSSPKGIEDLANSSNRKRFEDLQLDKLAFPDYSHEFAHHAWTVGFMSRPGGPDIYINKMDNSRVHGPGGQKQHILDEQGDACFGRITKGKEHIESILFKYAVMGEGKYQFAMRKQVPIVRAIILTPKPQAATPMDLEEIPEPMEIRFGRSLKEALAPLEQTLIESPAMNADLTDDVVGTSTSKTTNETKAAKELLKKNTTSDYNKTTIDTKTAANVASKNDAVDVDVQL